MHHLQVTHKSVMITDLNVESQRETRTMCLLFTTTNHMKHDGGSWLQRGCEHVYLDMLDVLTWSMWGLTLALTRLSLLTRLLCSFNLI